MEENGSVTDDKQLLQNKRATATHDILFRLRSPATPGAKNPSLSLRRTLEHLRKDEPLLTWLRC